MFCAPEGCCRRLRRPHMGGRQVSGPSTGFRSGRPSADLYRRAWRLSGQFADAYGNAIAKDNRVIVSEQYPGRLQIFRYVTDAEAEEARKKQVNEPATPSPKATPPPLKQGDSGGAKAQGSAAP